MIISASYRTDIPAFYGDWFLNRIIEGYCLNSNPYNAQQVSEVSLKRCDVDGIVFWTKNIRPFRDNLGKIHKYGYPFYIQYTLNDYPKVFEPSLPDCNESLDIIHTTVEKYGRGSIVWRYDPIIFSSETGTSYHIDKFGWLAEQLTGYVDEVVISFLQVYNKTAANLEKQCTKSRIEWHDPVTQEKLNLLAKLQKIACKNSMKISICSQPEFQIDGVGIARCIDIKRLSERAGRAINASLKGMREKCGCYAAKDIGAYDTCIHGCAYCYATKNQSVARSNFENVDATSSSIIPLTIDYKPLKSSHQLSLFDRKSNDNGSKTEH